MYVENRAATIEFFVKRTEGRICYGPVSNESFNRGANHFQLSERSIQFFKSFVDMRQRHRREGLEFRGPAVYDLCVQVIGLSRRIHRVLFIVEVRRLRADGQNLHVHTIGLHQCETLLYFFLADSCAFIPLGAGVRVPVTLRQVQVLGRPEVSVDIDARSFFSLSIQPAAEKKPCRGE